MAQGQMLGRGDLIIGEQGPDRRQITPVDVLFAQSRDHGSTWGARAEPPPAGLLAPPASVMLLLETPAGADS
jgi:hypothetical protein